MNWLKEFGTKLVLKYLGGDMLENLLSKLPANGRKTISTIVVTIVLTAAAMAGGSTPEWLVVIVGLVGELGVAPLADPTALAADVGAFLSALFAFHKVLKNLKAKYDDTREAELSELNKSELPKAKGY